MQGIITRYHGPTNTRAARMSATSTAGKRKYFHIPAVLYSTDAQNHQETARAFVIDMGWRGDYFSGAYNDKGALIWVCATPNWACTSFKVR